MIITSTTVAQQNLRALESAYERADGESEEAYIKRLIDRGIVHVDPDGKDAHTITVEFNLMSVWAVRKDSSPTLIDLLKSLIPTAASAFSLNGVPLATTILSSIDSATTVISKMIETPVPIEKNLSLRVPSEPIEAEEHYNCSINVQGSTLTTDDGSNEHACLPIMKFRFMDQRKSDQKFNAGLKEPRLIDTDYVFACTQVKPQMISKIDLRAILQTDGDVPLILFGLVSNATMSAVAIHKIEFEFTRCSPNAGNAAIPPTSLDNHHLMPSHEEPKPSTAPPIGSGGLTEGPTIAPE
jgi:hypothetical protein